MSEEDGRPSDSGSSPTEVLRVLTGPLSATLVAPTPGILIRPQDPTSQDPSEQRRLGRYEVVGLLGEGGMGKVVEAYDPELRRRVAIKLIKSPLHRRPTALARFIAEAQITSQLGHPNIIPVYDIGMTRDGGVWFAMKKIEGHSLHSVLRDLRDGVPAVEEEWSLHRLLLAFRQVCQAVAAAHDLGVVHRDLKPANIMLGRYSEVLVLDWGVAALRDLPDAVSEVPPDRLEFEETVAGAVIGTPGHMSPEQAAGHGELVGPTSDVWSLGAVLYELLTLEPAYEAEDPRELLHSAASSLPMNPRERAPHRNISTEMGELCLQALASDPAARFPDAGRLAKELERVLEGKERRTAAEKHLAVAEADWERYRALEAERAALLSRRAELAQTLAPWDSLEVKAELIRVDGQLKSIESERTDRFAGVLASCERAHARDPGNQLANDLLARVHYRRFEEAEALGAVQDTRFHEQRVLLYGGNHYAALLQGTGTLTLRTEPAGAEVICERYDTELPHVWTRTERRVIGTTPLINLPLARGSYLLTIRSPGKRDTLYPVFIPRSRHWDSGSQPIPLFSDAAIGEGMVYVPPGPFLCGGDSLASDSLCMSEPSEEGFFLAVLPVTMQQYCDFINALAATSAEEAWARVPRQESGLQSGGGGQYWRRPAAGEAYAVPELDSDGDRWDPRWPVHSVSWEDAQAYLAWRSERDGITWSLPTERQWEKAARGCDGRVFPWGGGFDPTLCKMRDSRQERPQPEPVGAFPSDSSPHGVRDLAGGMREWCADPSYGGDSERRPVRGGSWNTPERFCRAAHRSGGSPRTHYSSVGFRTARSCPDD